MTRPGCRERTGRPGRTGFPGRTVVLALALTGWLLIGLAGPAAAHTGGRSGASNVRTVLTDPGADCLNWTVEGPDGFLGLRNRCPATVVVLGYEDEPYLEFSAAGVRENRNSPATYLNRDAAGGDGTAVPPTARADAEPDWVLRSDEPFHRWHDHRAHWMSATPPGGGTALPPWSIPLRFVGDTAASFAHRSAATGVFSYEPPIALWVPLAPAAFVAGSVTVIALLRRHPTRRLAGPVAALVGLVAVLTLAVAVDDLVRARRTGDPLWVTAVVAVPVVGGALWAAQRGRRGDHTAFLALFGAAAALGWAYGWADRSSLTASQLPGSLPDLLVRVTVGLQLLVVVPAGVALAVSRSGPAHRGQGHGVPGPGPGPGHGGPTVEPRA